MLAGLELNLGYVGLIAAWACKTIIRTGIKTITTIATG